MKQILITSVLACYLAFSCGVMVNFHYCMNKLASTEFFSTAKKQCGKCGMKKHQDNDCCRDEVQVVKMDDDQRPVFPVDFQLASLLAVEQVPSDFIVTSFYNFLQASPRVAHAPPIPDGEELHIVNSVFRI